MKWLAGDVALLRIGYMCSTLSLRVRRLCLTMSERESEINYVPFEEALAKALEDPEVRAEWDRTQLADDVSNWLLGYRIEHDLTQAELAKMLGWTQSVVARLESGEREPAIMTLQHLVRCLGTTATIAIRPERVEVRFGKPRAIPKDVRRGAQRAAALDGRSSPRPRRGPITRRGGTKRSIAVEA